jgi:hypothetical protein
VLLKRVPPPPYGYYSYYKRKRPSKTNPVKSSQNNLSGYATNQELERNGSTRLPFVGPACTERNM